MSIQRRKVALLALVSVVLIGILIATADAQSRNVPGLTMTQQPPISDLAPPVDEAVYIVLFNDAPLVSHLRQGLGLDHLTPRAPFSQAYRQQLLTEQAEFVTAIEKLIGRPLNVSHHYTIASNGIALTMTAAEAQVVATDPGVRLVRPSRSGRPASDAGPSWIGAPGLWEGNNTGGLPGTKGEGIIVGIIDTGINMDHPSFADVGHDGYDHENPYGSGNYVGYCASDPANFVCNDKLIGAWSWAESGDDPEDDWGHGSNVAGITIGNVVTLTYQAPTIVLTPTLSGVAPHANLIAYDVCNRTSGCPDHISMAAIDQAILDGVDVLNFSIKTYSGDPWSEPLALAFLAAREAGIFIATSAGNDGPNPYTIVSPANAPWMTTVGNSTHHARFDNSLVNLSGGDGVPPPDLMDLMGSSVTGGYGPALIVLAADYLNNVGAYDGTCAGSYPAGTWTTEIVFCEPGGPNSRQKASNVAAGGGKGVVIVTNATTNQALGIDRLVLPGLNLRKQEGDSLLTWLQAGSGRMGTILGTARSKNPDYGDELNLGSSRGPTPFTEDILKPNLVAPGTKIWSAGHTTNPSAPPELNFYTGTSQASPHVAGAAALVGALHTTWTVAEIESALMTTSLTNTVHFPGGVTPTSPFDVGAGRVDLTTAARAGLVLNETAVNFRAANPALGGDPAQLNLASFANGSCVGRCDWIRQVKNALPVTGTWTVTSTTSVSLTLNISPTTFTLGPGENQAITVTADVSASQLGDWLFGEIRLRELSALAPLTHFPVAVRSAPANLIDTLQIDTRQNVGSHLLSGLQASGITTLTVNSFGLVPATISERALSQDSNRGSPFDDLNDGVFYITSTVPLGAKRLVAQILTSEAPDVELFVGLDTGDGIPQSNELVCSGETPKWQESCDLIDPAAGEYWVLVQNWAASATPPVTDTIILATAVISNAGSSNSHLAGPLGSAVTGPFELRYFWNEPAMQTGDHWFGAFNIGSSPSTPGDIALVPVNLIRHENDVTYSSMPMTVTVGVPVTFTITVQPNVTPVDLTYAITATIPSGLRYVPISATHGGVLQGDDLTWRVIVPKLGYAPVIISYQLELGTVQCGQQITSELTYSTDNLGSLAHNMTIDTGTTCLQLYFPFVSHLR